MDSETRTGIVPCRIPQEIIDEILDRLAADEAATPSLRSCSLVSKSWVQSCRRHLFRDLSFASENVERWFKTFLVPEESPVHHVRHLRIVGGGGKCVPDAFFEYTPWFANAETISLLTYGGIPPSRVPSLWRLPQSINTLTINGGMVTLPQIRDIMAGLPNLDNLSLSGSLVPVDRKELLGIGTTLNGRFGGRLKLHGGLADDNVINMLLEIPGGLRFTELQVQCHHKCPLAASLAEVCSRNLVTLVYTVSVPGGMKASERCFDFSTFPNLKKVHFILHWMDGDLHWIPKALSTLGHPTSPHLSAVQLVLILPFTSSQSAWQHTPSESIETLVKDAANDLRRVADEFSRIDREFGGAVKVTVFGDPSGFGVVLDRLNILQQYRLQEYRR